MTTEKKPLDADVYDTLELMALAFDGIGCGPWFKPIEGDTLLRADYNCPNCAHGLLLAADGGYHGAYPATGSNGISQLLRLAGVGGVDSDLAVQRIRDRKGAFRGRVTFAEWCEETGIVRATA